VSGLELGVWIVPVPTRDGEETAEAERLGFDAALYGDSQMSFGDPYVRMAFAAARTARIVLAPGIAAPATRDSSVTAACVGAVHLESGGRARLCIGAGDSALSSIGRRAPLRLAEFERNLHEVRGYLRGEEVDRGGTPGRVGFRAVCHRSRST
jgi:5,10-methylenetetrahydromethanopterin reductase